LIGEVEAMVVAHIERKPEQLGVGDRPGVIGGRSSNGGDGSVIHCWLMIVDVVEGSNFFIPL